jgi:predicted signal transduction protein with EAL and GGDEF domain
LLRLAADRLTSLIRAEDKVVRLGGDEFTVLLHAVEHDEGVSHVATRIAQLFVEPFHILNQALHIGTSIGISMFPQDGVDADMLIQKADIAMYASKAEGKGTYRFYNDELYKRIRARLNAEEELSGAIVKRQFDMVYQPRFNTHTGEISGLEALVRWHHPVRGVIPPI